MSDTVIRVENLSKEYKLGLVVHDKLADLISAGAEKVTGGIKKLLNISEPDDKRERIKKQDMPEYIWAIKDVSFEVKQGEIVGIIGKNGAGKSTLLKILTGLTEPTEGRVWMKGRVGSLLEVGTGFHPELTGRENVFLNGAILGMTRAEIKKKFDEIVAFAEIEKFIDTPVKRYSSGMYVRLAFAVAAHLEPEILFIDEVLAVGDIAFQKKCLGKMGEVSKEGRTVLLVSHSMPSIMNICQRVILMNSGNIVANGKSSDVVQQYLSTGRSTDGEVFWQDSAEAPGNDIVRLLAVRILQDGIEGSTADVDISKEVRVQLEYRNFKKGERLYGCIWLRGRTGIDVLATASIGSMNLIEDPWYGKPRPVGVFRAECRIPANFLNDIRYSVTAIIGKDPTNTQILEEDIVTFNVHDTGEMRKEYYNEWFGVVRPKLVWKTEYLGDGKKSIVHLDNNILDIQ